MKFKLKYKYFFYFIVLIFIIFFSTIKTNTIVNQPYFIKLKNLFPHSLKDDIKKSNFFKYIIVKSMTMTAKNKFNNKNILDIRNLLMNEYILEPEQITYFEKLDLIESINSKKCKESQDAPFQYFFCKSSKFYIYPDENRKVMGAKYYDINNYSILEHSNYNSNDKKKLLIYLSGHDGNPYGVTKRSVYFLDIKEHYKKKGFDVMSLSMSNLGYNEEPVNFPLIDLSKKEDKIHDMYINFYDESYPRKKPLSLMLSGNYYLIKKVLSESSYDEIYMIGVSGGGWYSTFIAAVIPEIKSSYSFTGTMPTFLRLFERIKGDFEQSGSKIFDRIDYWDLYYLATLDNFNKQNRKHTQVYNRYESVFADPFATIMKNVSDNLKNSYFKVEALEVDEHVIDKDFLFSQF